MDFDDLGRKLQRMYAELGEAFSVDISNNIIDERHTLADGIVRHQVKFGSNDPIVRENLVFDAVHAIASLKDIINIKLKDKGYSGHEYEILINQNESLQILTDLDNKNKHGNKLSNRRYKEDVTLTNINQVLRGKGITTVRFSTDLVTGKTILDKSAGNVKIVIVGDILNNQGVTVGRLDEILDETTNKIEEFIYTNKLT